MTAAQTAKHIVLLGDSILDNAAYTSGDPDVRTHLEKLLRSSGEATLLAQDGALTKDVLSQAERVPASATHLVVSMGGNDALNAISLLHAAAPSVAHALALFEDPLAMFESDYVASCQRLTDLGLPVTVCTIYNGDFQPGLERSSTTTAVRLYNDSISRHARAFGFDVIELRSVCTESTDYWNPIEPSGQGGRKIAEAIKRHVNPM